MSSGRILVYGGKGALGSTIVDYFKNKSFWVLNVDLITNSNADANIVLKNSESFVDQGSFLKNEMNKLMGVDNKLDAIMCVAGGWAGGNAAANDMLKNTDLVWRQSVWSSTIASHIASLFLKKNGILQLTGAAAALGETPSMIGYGMAKAAVHQLTKSLAQSDSGLPDAVSVLTIAPGILDTPMNRKWMPKADFKTWTSLNYVSELLHEWTVNINSRPPNGSVVKMITNDGKTSLELH